MIPTYPNFTSSRFASSLPSFIFVTDETSHPPGAPWGSCNLVASSAWYHLAVSKTCAQLSRLWRCPKAVYQVAGNVVHEIRDYILRPRALIQTSQMFKVKIHHILSPSTRHQAILISVNLIIQMIWATISVTRGVCFGPLWSPPSCSDKMHVSVTTRLRSVIRRIPPGWCDP